MNPEKHQFRSTIVVAGGGPAGAGTAIRLAMAGYSVALVERERFPRHKLCGEFISPECLDHFADLCVLDEILAAGGERIAETTFFDRKGRNFTVPSSMLGNGLHALSLSRSEMDRILLDRARAAGVTVIDGARAVELIMENGMISAIGLIDETGVRSVIEGRIFVDATGRARALVRLSNKTEGPVSQTAGRGRPLSVAFKNHFEGAGLKPSVCEIYAIPGGYGGLTTIEGGRTNLCFLIDPATARSFGPRPEKLVNSLLRQNARLSHVMAGARPLMEWHAVSIDSFGRAAAPTIENLFTVGDSAAFIDPFTGSGMLMALESSALLALAIAASDPSPISIRTAYIREFERVFSRRLRVCSVLRKAAFFRHFPSAAVAFLGFSRHGRELLAASTRSAGRPS